MDTPWLEFTKVEEIPEPVSNRGRKSRWGELFDWAKKAPIGEKVRLTFADKSTLHNAHGALYRWNWRNRDEYKLYMVKDPANLVLWIEKR